MMVNVLRDVSTCCNQWTFRYPQIWRCNFYFYYLFFYKKITSL